MKRAIFVLAVIAGLSATAGGPIDHRAELRTVRVASENGRATAESSSPPAAGAEVQPPADPATPVRAAPIQELVVTGVLLNRDAEELSLHRARMPEAHFSIMPRTRWLLDGTDARAADLKPGTPVKVTFQLDGHTPVALKVEGVSAATGR